MVVKFKQPIANPPVCWICGRKLYGGGRVYKLVNDYQGNEHPAHKQCYQDDDDGVDLWETEG